ncbi:hypothetical protein NPIL_544751 [Nephila pilipes]|uniref:Uncharacterized protein n=1 Tax=Nephila pilipes TaxID=299642 RepID=A0A8X6QZ79_NEPPI|nr:hypothetical protein NPIL_544751 [Nephila pilipes]
MSINTTETVVTKTISKYYEIRSMELDLNVEHAGVAADEGRKSRAEYGTRSKDHAFRRIPVSRDDFRTMKGLKAVFHQNRLNEVEVDSLCSAITVKFLIIAYPLSK